MNNTLLAVIVSLVAGFAVGAWTTMASSPVETPAATADAFDADAPLEARIAALEQAVSGERDARLVLEEQLHGLYAELERFDSPELNELLRTLAENSEAREQAQAQQAVRRERGARMQDFKDLRVSRLVAGGFSESRAQKILQFEDEARMAALQAEYEARRNGEAIDPWGRASDLQATLRERLGDAEYEQYLTAQGGQASITVREVIGSSPANQAGLRPGDRILSYDGERVFGMNDLKSMAFSGDPGEDVIVDIERNGQRMQLVLPRGPLGITGSGGGMGFRSPFGG